MPKLTIPGPAKVEYTTADKVAPNHSAVKMGPADLDQPSADFQAMAAVSSLDPLDNVELELDLINQKLAKDRELMTNTPTGSARHKEAREVFFTHKEQKTDLQYEKQDLMIEKQIAAMGEMKRAMQELAASFRETVMDLFKKVA